MPSCFKMLLNLSDGTAVRSMSKDICRLMAIVLEMVSLGNHRLSLCRWGSLSQRDDCTMVMRCFVVDWMV